MVMIKVAGFAGENRAVHPLLLPEVVGVLSRNQKPGRADLRPWKSPSPVASVPAGRSTIYRMGRDVDSDSNYWLSWTTVVHAVRGFSASDTTEQTFYTGDGAPKFTNNVIGLATAPYPTASRPMGIPAPTTAPTVVGTNSGATSPVVESYVYVYTYVNDLGWESAPSPVSALVTRDTLGTTAISGFATAPSGNYNITAIRIYKSQNGSTANLYFLTEIAYGTTSTTDTNQTFGDMLETATWLPAPGVPTGGEPSVTEPTLSFLTPMWNGMMAGISGGSVRVCEPYVPYAWPASYDVIPADGKPVGLGVFGQNMLVLTTSRPVLVNGSTPDGLDQQAVEMPQGCVASRSIVSMGAGVAWASEDGLCWVGVNGAKILTAGLMLREDWQALVPSSIIGRMYEGLYFGSYDDGAGRKGFLIDPANPTGIYFLDTGYSAMHFDELKDQLYVLDGTNVSKWDAGTAMTCRFKSKVFKTPKPLNFAVAEVVSDAYPVTFKMYVDGSLRHTQVVTGRNPFRVPSGYLGLDWQIEIEGTQAVQVVFLASSMQELSTV